MKYRNRLEIFALILENANCGGGKGTTSTGILQKSLLTHNHLKLYLPILIEKELIQYQNNERIYTTTERGRDFLRLYYQICDSIKLKSIDLKNVMIKR